MCRSGQQILLGDRVVVKGEQPGQYRCWGAYEHLQGSLCVSFSVSSGTVKYIGKLEFDPFDRVFIGVHVDAPGHHTSAGGSGTMG